MHLTREARCGGWPRSAPVTYVVFDLLCLDGHSLMDAPYDERRARARGARARRASAGRRPTTDDGDGARAAGGDAASRGLEGDRGQAAGLAATSPGGAAGAWIKIKNVKRAGARRSAAGCRARGAGASASARCWSGCRDARRAAALRGPRRHRLHRGRARPAGRRCWRRCARDRRPFDARPGVPRGRAVRRAASCVAEVEFGEWTRTGVLRAPSLQGAARGQARRWRSRARPSGRARTQARRGRGRTARAIARPTSTRSSTRGRLHQGRPHRLLRARSRRCCCRTSRDRPLTLKRYPNGVEGKFFYEKQAPSHRPDWVATAPVRPGSKTIDFMPRQRPADAGLAGQPRRPRAAHVAVPGRGASSARR